MATEKPADKGQVYKLELTPEQQAAIRDFTGGDGDVLWLTIQELEDRLCRAATDRLLNPVIDTRETLPGAKYEL